VTRRLRAAIDSNVLISSVLQPRFPFEVLAADLAGLYDLVIPRQVLEETQRHLDPDQWHLLEELLSAGQFRVLPVPGRNVVQRNRSLVRDETDVPIACALVSGRVPIFVSMDRDFTEGASTTFRQAVTVDLPAAFLRHRLRWTSERIETVRTRTWEDLEQQALARLDRISPGRSSPRLR
jgi:predicted nucleic acid-binding protein